jgi:uncharacterized protein involved in response to NO
MALIFIEEPRVPKNGKSLLSDHPVLRLGFRPFYLLAAAFAAISVPLWISRYFGWTQGLKHVDLNWHMHEMIFGFAVAVIIGFLYTAGRNWSGLWTPRGKPLAAIAGLWIAGRVAMLFADPVFAAIIDLAFLPVAAWPLYRVLNKSGNKRNLFLVGLLAMIAIADAAFHAAVLGLLNISTVQPVHAAILIIVIIELVIGGRVIPGFTANAVQGVKPIVNVQRDRISIVLTASACVAWISGFPVPLTAALAMAAACAQLTRLAGWMAHRTLKHPLLWVLHLSYAWIPFGFGLLSLAALNIVSASAAIHVLAVGSMAGLIIGMTTRTALGHTGRALKVGAKEVAMYGLIQVGAVARFVAAVDAAGMRDVALITAMVAWSIAFVLYVVVYGPYLFKARVDGREG